MAPATVREHLLRVLQAEGVQADDGSLRLLARAARGSMRDGLSLTDQAIAYGSGRLDEGVVRAMLGSVDRGHARAIVLAVAARDGAAVLAAVDGLRGLGLSAAATLEEVAMLLQQMAVEQAVPGALDTQDPDTEDARQLAPVMPADETQLLYSMVLHGRDELSLMSDEYAALTMVLLRPFAFAAQGSPAAARPAESPREPRSAPLRAPAPPALAVAQPAAPRTVPLPASASPPDVPVRVPATPAQTAAAVSEALTPVALPPPPDAGATPVAAAPSAAPVPVPVPIAAPRELGERWNQLVKSLAEQGAIAAMVRELAQQAGLLRIDENTVPPSWHLVVEREPLRNPAMAEKLGAALGAALGHVLQVVVQAGVPDDSPARRDAAERARRQSVAEDTIHNDPVVRELLSQFKSARIVPGSIKPV
jgi:DNA polymerase-3 subunit gamma/tau